jgi:CheY-like chemotaxis protein/signal transduction histidine kinase
MLSDTLDLLLAGATCSRGAAYTVSGGSLELVAEHGIPREQRAALERLPLAGAPWFAAQRAAQQRKLVIDNGVEGPLGPFDRASLAAAGWACSVACPLIVGRQVYGAIVLAWPANEEPAPAALSTLEVACGLVALHLACQSDVERRAEVQNVGVRAARLTALGLLASGFAEEASQRLDEVARGVAEQQRAVDAALTRPGPGVGAALATRAAETAGALQRAQVSAARFRAVTESGTPERVDLRELAADAIALIQPMFRQRRIDIELRADGGHLVVGRRGELIQLMVQILVNIIGAPDDAEDAHAEELIPRGYILGIQRRGSHEVVSVNDAGDEGTGARASLFDEVKQMDEHPVDFAVAQHIVIAHEGHIEIGDALPGGGVACSVVLPAARSGADLAGRYDAIANAPAHLRRQLADGARPVLHWIDADDLFLEIMVQSLQEFEVRVARTAAQAMQMLAYGSEPSLILCNVRLPDRPGHALHSELAMRHPRLARRFVFIADGVLTPEIASYLIRSRCPTLMRPIDLDQVRSLALRDGAAGLEAVGAPTLSEQQGAGSGVRRSVSEPPAPGPRQVSRYAPTAPAMPAVRPRNDDTVDAPPRVALPPPTPLPVPLKPRSDAPPARRAATAAPAESFRDQELAAIAQATVATLRRDGPKRGGHVVAMLRARGLAEGEALAVITFGLSNGLLVRDPPPSTMLRASDEDRKRTVLVVDDDYDLRETMRDVLEDEGYIVETASNGQEALDCLRDGNSPEVVVLDLMMPVMDGWHFLDELKREPALADIPVVVMSASQEGLRGLGAKEFLSKPLDYHKLVATVDRSLKSRLGLR